MRTGTFAQTLIMCVIGIPVMNATTVMRQSFRTAALCAALAVSSWTGLSQTPEQDELIAGKLRWEVYEGIPGVTLADLTSHPKFPDESDAVEWVTEFETPEQWGDNYGARLTGLVVPPVSGEYVFYIASDDQGVLYLSRDENPANKVLIASEPMWSPPRMWIGRDPEQSEAKRSAPIFLEAGHRYYVEALMKEAGGGDHLGVTWQMPDQPAVENGASPISGEHLAAWGTPQPPTPTRELHVVGVYSGITPGGGASRDHEPGDASIVVDRPGRSVTLFLSAYEPVLWHVSTSPDTIIEKVILGGYYEQGVTGLEPEVETVQRWYENGTSQYLWVGYQVDSIRFYRSVPKIHDLTGLEIASFHGVYAAPYPEPFVIDEVQDDPRLRSDYPQPLSPADVPNVGFQMAFYRESTPLRAGNILIRDCLLTGPLDNAGLLPAERVAMDGYRLLYYGAANHRVWKVEGPSGGVEDLDPGPGLPELSWPTGVTFDTERDRLLVVSLGGRGYLYAYAPATGQWTMVADMANRDLDCLEYHGPDGCLYGVAVTHMDALKPAVLRFTANGEYLGKISLPVQPSDIGPGGYRSELVSLGDYLALLLEADPRFTTSHERQESRIYLIDPVSEEVWLTYRRVGAVRNQPPSVRITSPPEWTLFDFGEPIMVRAAVDDPDGEVMAVEILADGPRVGAGTRMPGGDLFEFLWPAALVGDVHLVAEAIDASGGRAMSVPVWITIDPPSPSLVMRRFAEVDSATGRVHVELCVEPGAPAQSVAVEDRPPAGWRVSEVSHDGVYDPVTGRVKFGPFFDREPRILGYTVQASAGALGTFQFEGRGSADGVNSPIGGQQEVTLVGCHPADQDPPDWQLTIGEVTAYGAAWRRNEPWPVPPNPIPMNYVTWAAALWRAGEGYGFEPQVREPPLWWVSDTRFDISGVGGIGLHSPRPRSTAVRELPLSCMIGGSVVVSLAVSPAAGIRAYAAQERLPEGCTAAEIGSGGVFDPGLRTLRWGPFLDGKERQLTYRLEPARDSASPLEFEGQVSFDGVSQPLAGRRSLRAGCGLQIASDPESRSLRLKVRSENESRYVVETSADLQNWQPVTEVVAVDDWMEIRRDADEEDQSRFYRLRSP